MKSAERMIVGEMFTGSSRNKRTSVPSYIPALEFVVPQSSPRRIRDLLGAHSARQAQKDTQDSTYRRPGASRYSLSQSIIRPTEPRPEAKRRRTLGAWWIPRVVRTPVLIYLWRTIADLGRMAGGTVTDKQGG